MSSAVAAQTGDRPIEEDAVSRIAAGLGSWSRMIVVVSVDCTFGRPNDAKESKCQDSRNTRTRDRELYKSNGVVRGVDAGSRGKVGFSTEKRRNIHWHTQCGWRERVRRPGPVTTLQKRD